ncbi:MAG: hypothetical protein B7C55_11550 [Actinomycetales bacterium mxb001]|nr:MAG: hypothetical protein B7C55_11550 [Actinomycetales bacterium mxb001]
MNGLASLLLLTQTPVPSPLPDEPPIDPSRITPGLLGLASFLFLIVAVVLLYRSMRKQMSKVDPDLPEGPGDRERAEDARLTEEAEKRGEADDAPENRS